MEEPVAFDNTTTATVLSTGTCLICLAEGSSADCLLWSSETDLSALSWNGTDEKMEEGRRCLRRHLGSLFILRNLLDLSLEQCTRVLGTTGGNPGDWFFVCESCSKLIRAGFEIHAELLELERKLERIRQELVESLKDSLGRKEIKTKRVGEGKVSEAHHLIRECFTREKRKSTKESRCRKRAKIKKAPRRNGRDDEEKMKMSETKLDEEERKSVLMTRSETDEGIATETVTSVEDNPGQKMALPSENEARRSSGESDAGSLYTPEDVDEEDVEETLKCKRKSVSSEDEELPERPEAQSRTKKKARTKESVKCMGVRKIPEFPPHCIICGIRHHTYNFYLDHKNAHANPDYVSNFKCDKCEFVGRSKLMVRRHLRDAHGESPKKPSGQFLCDKCDYVSTMHKNLRQHMKSHEVTDNFELLDGELWIRCKLCGVEDTKLKMYSHMKAVHSLTANSKASMLKDKDGAPLLCHVCSKTFSSRRSLLEHIRSIHENKKRFFCNICGQGFMGKRQFDDHVARHTSPNIYTCSDCPLSFRCKSRLQSHYVENHRKGLPVKPLELKVTCKFCGVKLAHATALGQHYKATHPDKLIFKCEECESAFINRDGLQLHVKCKHSGKKFTCEHCFTNFNWPRFTHHRRTGCKKRKTLASDTKSVNSGDIDKVSDEVTIQYE